MSLLHEVSAALDVAGDGIPVMDGRIRLLQPEELQSRAPGRIHGSRINKEFPVLCSEIVEER